MHLCNVVYNNLALKLPATSSFASPSIALENASTDHQQNILGNFSLTLEWLTMIIFAVLCLGTVAGVTSFLCLVLVAILCGIVCQKIMNRKSTGELD